MKSQNPGFRISVHFIPFARNTPPLQGRYRPLLRIGGMLIGSVWPDFLDNEGRLLSSGSIIPPDCQADMFIYAEEVRTLLRDVISVGRRIELAEANHPVATGEVTCVSDL
jgi:hypothetical protein